MRGTLAHPSTDTLCDVWVTPLALPEVASYEIELEISTPFSGNVRRFLRFLPEGVQPQLFDYEGSEVNDCHEDEPLWYRHRWEAALHRQEMENWLRLDIETDFYEWEPRFIEQLGREVPIPQAYFTAMLPVRIPHELTVYVRPTKDVLENMSLETLLSWS